MKLIHPYGIGAVQVDDKLAVEAYTKYLDTTNKYVGKLRSCLPEQVESVRWELFEGTVKIGRDIKDTIEKMKEAVEESDIIAAAKERLALIADERKLFLEEEYKKQGVSKDEAVR